MKTLPSWPRRMSILIVVALAFLVACHLTKENAREQVFNFPTLADTLGNQECDSALILLQDSEGHILDTLFNDRVQDATFSGLPARNYQGGQAVVIIKGFSEGDLVYHVEKTYSGTSGEVEKSIVVISRPLSKVDADSVVISPEFLLLRVRGPVGELRATVFPDTISQIVTWKSLNSAVATVSSKGVVSGVDTGMAIILATSDADKQTSDTILVQVQPPIPVGSVTFDRNVLNLYANGSAESLLVSVLPIGANPNVRYFLADSSLAQIQDGKIRGFLVGETFVTAISVEDSTKSATMRIFIHSKPPVPVDSVTVSPDTVRLYTGGENLTLAAVIYPRSHEARFVWQSADPTIANMDGNGNVSPVSAGRVYVGVRSLLDSTKGDSALVIVRKDTPRIDVGGDTTVSVGTNVVYSPKLYQEYGTIQLVRWDLDDSVGWDDSATAFRSLSWKYSTPKAYTVRFYAKDSEGNDTVVSKKVEVVDGAVVLIQTPVNGYYTNQNPITVTWTVDDVLQSSLDSLVAGANVITRTTKNAAGDLFSATITVYFDTIPPASPIVSGPSSPISSLKPSWKWEPSGGGNGTFRYRLNVNSMASGASEVTDTTFTPGTNLAGGIHTLYVQERDSAGNWSSSGSYAIRIDTTKPSVPIITLTQSSPTNERRPTWIWNHSEPGAGFYRYRLDNGAFRDTNSTSFRPAQYLSEDIHTLHVQEGDSAGNWSDIATSSIQIDTTAPGTPVFNLTPKSPSATLRPTWTWTTGGGGNGNFFRYSLDNSAFRDTVSTSFQSGNNLSEGVHTLRIQEVDLAGNVSSIASRQIVVVARGYVGNPNFSNGMINAPTLAVRGRDTVYVAYTTQNSKLMVQKFSNGSWTDLGTGLYTGDCTHPFMNVSNAGIPYVTFRNSKLSVMRLNGNSWSYVGVPEFSTDVVNYPQIHFSPTDIPYVLYEDAATGTTPLVARYSGVWENLSQSGIPSGSTVDYALAFQRNGDPVMAFAAFIDNRVTVVRYSFIQGKWDTLGNITALNRYATAIELAINSNDEPIVAFRDINDSRVHVIRLSGNTWINYGTLGQPASGYNNLGLALANDQTPIIAFQNEVQVSRLSIMGWDGNAWIHMGPEGLSEGAAGGIQLKTNSDGVPFAAYGDGANGGLNVYKTGY